MNPAPRLLVIDPTPIGSLCATGQFKQMLLAKWPRHRILELTTDMGSGATVLRRGQGRPDPYRSVGQTLDLIRKFAPQAIYVRPEPAEFRHMDFTLLALNELKQPAILHIMDDWVAGDSAPSEDSRKAVGRLANYIAARASLRYTDGPAYVADFGARLEAPFETLLNGVDLEYWDNPKPVRGPGQPFCLTHMGNYDAVMSRQAVLDIAEAVESLGREFDIRFDVYVRSYIIETARKELSRFSRTRVLPQEHDFNEYIGALRSSDVNVYAYNQDALSVQYMGKGIPNKTCELMAAGKPILAYGPASFAGVNYLRDHGAACVVGDRQALASAIRDLHNSPGMAADLVAKADALVREKHDAAEIRSHFLNAVRGLAESGAPVSPPDFAGVKYDWWDVLRPAILDQRLRRTRKLKLRNTAAALPRLVAHSILYLRSKPLACATVIVLAASLTVTSGSRQFVIAGMVAAGVAWMASQSAMRLIRVFGDRVLNPEAHKLQVIRRVSNSYSHAPWTFAFVVACGALGGLHGWQHGWVPVAGAGVLATLLAFTGVAGWSYRASGASPNTIEA